MKRMEVKHFEEFMRKYYPNFKLANDELISTWVSELARFPLRDCERAITVYYAHSKTRYEPTLGQLKEILEANEVKTSEPMEKVEPDYDIRYQKLDKENGEMNWLVPHYATVWRLVKIGRFPFVREALHPTYEEFRECMKRWCWENYNRAHFCLSENELKAMSKLEQEEKLREALAVIHASGLKVGLI